MQIQHIGVVLLSSPRRWFFIMFCFHDRMDAEHCYCICRDWCRRGSVPRRVVAGHFRFAAGSRLCRPEQTGRGLQMASVVLISSVAAQFGDATWAVSL